MITSIERNYFRSIKLMESKIENALRFSDHKYGSRLNNHIRMISSLLIQYSEMKDAINDEINILISNGTYIDIYFIDELFAECKEKSEMYLKSYSLLVLRMMNE